MPELSLALASDGRWVQAGSEVAGEAGWQLGRDSVDAIELRLLWFCRGEGSEDVEVVDTRRIERPGSSGSRSFRFRVPDGPYSFSGSLFTLAWALEMVVLPSGESTRLDLTVGPRPVEVRAQAVRS